MLVGLGGRICLAEALPPEVRPEQVASFMEGGGFEKSGRVPQWLRIRIQQQNLQHANFFCTETMTIISSL